MSYRQVSRVIYGFRIKAEIDRWDEKYSPHIEGHPDTDIMMYNSESEKDVWYCGILLASSNDGIYKEIKSFSPEQYAGLLRFTKMFFPEVRTNTMYMLNMME